MMQWSDSHEGQQRRKGRKLTDADETDFSASLFRMNILAFAPEKTKKNQS